MSEPLPHAVEAPLGLQQEAMAALEAARTAQKPDKFGRFDWLEISQNLKAWWKERGYVFP